MKTILLTVVSLCVLSACGHPTATPHETSSQSNSSHVNRQQSSKPSQAVKVSVSAVVELMHDRWGTDVDLSSIEIEPHGNQYQYDVEAVDDDTEYQMVLDGRTGRVLRQAQHALAADEAGGVERQEHAINTEHLLALGHITQAATQAVPGTAREWSLEQDDGVPVWSVKIQTAHAGQREVSVQADTGKVLATSDDD
ncbi:PepSY domain-containing protein [Lacticaseibacillus thailandensis]|nr:PepSY domain-containing protein [Lacticaseibacillus thailandensis]